MVNYELLLSASELKDDILSLKAVSDSFFNQFVCGNAEDNIISVTMQQETYTYLYRVISDLIFQMKDQANNLEASLEAALNESTMKKKLQIHKEIEAENAAAYKRFLESK